MSVCVCVLCVCVYTHTHTHEQQHLLPTLIKELQASNDDADAP